MYSTSSVTRCVHNTAFFAHVGSLFQHMFRPSSDAQNWVVPKGPAIVRLWKTWCSASPTQLRTCSTPFVTAASTEYEMQHGARFRNSCKRWRTATYRSFTAALPNRKYPVQVRTWVGRQACVILACWVLSMQGSSHIGKLEALIPCGNGDVGIAKGSEVNLMWQ